MAALLLCTWSQIHAAELAVVIDDLGYSLERGLRAINLPGPITVAVLPFAPNTQRLTEHALENGTDIIIHQPMEPYPAAHVRTEVGTLRLSMDDYAFDALVLAARDAVPASIGLSNHTGSLLTQHREPMRRLMSSLSGRGLFFLDSRTTADTIALDVAREFGVPAIRRDVFLDHDRRPQSVNRAFRKAIGLARRNGTALIIAHPYRVSLDYLEWQLADLPADINLVPAKALTRPTRLARQPGPADLHISLGQ